MSDKSGKGKSKAATQGKHSEEQSTKGGKSHGKKGSGNTPQEPVVQAKTPELAVSSTGILKPVATPDSTTKSVPEVEPAETTRPSKPQKPPTQKEAERAAEEDDENEDLQAALQTSLKAPGSPQIPSGAQSSDPKGTSDLEQQESEMMSQLDTLMTELVKLDSLPNPTIVQKSRIRSIHKVISDLEIKLEEVVAQRSMEKPSKARKIQEESAPATKPVSSLVPDKPMIAMVEKPVVLKSLTLPQPQPISVEDLMARNVSQPLSQATQSVSISKPQSQPQKAEHNRLQSTRTIGPSAKSGTFHTIGGRTKGGLPRKREIKKSPGLSEARSGVPRKSEKSSKTESRRTRKSESREPSEKARSTWDNRSRSSKRPDHDRSRSSKRPDPRPKKEVKKGETKV